MSIVKNGKTAQRKQRYLCKDCRRQFIRDYTNLGCVGAVRELVVPLTINGAGIRDIERVLFLSTNTILRTLRESATRLDEPTYPRRVRDLEMDEFWSFIGAKRRQRWTWYGYDRQRRKVVGFVNERRTYSSYTIDTFSLSILLSLNNHPLYASGRKYAAYRRRKSALDQKASNPVQPEVTHYGKEEAAPSVDSASGIGLSPRSRRTDRQSLRTRPANHPIKAGPKNRRGGKSK